MTAPATERSGAPEGTPRRRRSRPALVVAVAVGAVVLLLIVLLATREPSGDRATASALEGKPAPAVTGDVLLGEPFDLGATDRWVVVNFFATWCGPCIQEHPELRAFEEDHREKGDARVISVVYGDDAERVVEFFDRNGGDWTVFDADEGRTALEWGVTAVPESYLVDRNGVVRKRIIGGVTQEGLDALLAAARGGS